MSLSSCSVPGSKPTFELSADEVELGLGKLVTPWVPWVFPAVSILGAISWVLYAHMEPSPRGSEVF